MSQEQAFDSRRRMPQITFSKRIPEEGQNVILVSGNLDYFVRFGLSLINSINTFCPSQPIMINCVDFSMSTAENILQKYFCREKLLNVFLCKTMLNNFNADITPDQKMCFYKTIRYQVGRSLQKQVNVNLAICDIDALIISSNFSNKLSELSESSISMGVGATQDFLGKSLFEVGRNNYLWRTVKAGFTFFNTKKRGKECLNRVTQCLFNLEDRIPPIESLKLYRAYYGDQLALFMTALELNSAPKEYGFTISCLGYRENDIINFRQKEYGGCIWIPPGSYRKESEFDVSKIVF